MKMKTIFSVAAVSAVLALSGPAFAEFPEKPITLIIPWSAGGSTDQTARALAAAASKELGQPIVIVNKSGASTTLGMSELAAAAPDGYTIGTLSTTTYMAPITGTEVPYKMMESFDFISYYGDNLIGIAVLADKPWQTLDDLINASKEGNGFNYGTAGANTTQNLMTEALKQQTGAKFTHIPYRGSAESLPSLLGGHVDFITETSVWAPYVESGEVRILVVNTPERSASLPDVPTLKELGHPYLRSVQGIIAPAGLPEDVRMKLETAFRNALKDEQFVDLMGKLRMEIVDMSGEEMRETIGVEVENATTLYNSLAH